MDRSTIQHDIKLGLAAIMVDNRHKDLNALYLVKQNGHRLNMV
jgi:hypothetical protein